MDAVPRAAAVCAAVGVLSLVQGVFTYAGVADHLLSSGQITYENPDDSDIVYVYDPPSGVTFEWNRAIGDSWQIEAVPPGARRPGVKWAFLPILEGLLFIGMAAGVFKGSRAAAKVAMGLYPATSIPILALVGFGSIPIRLVFAVWLWRCVSDLREEPEVEAGPGRASGRKLAAAPAPDGPCGEDTGRVIAEGIVKNTAQFQVPDVDSPPRSPPSPPGRGDAGEGSTPGAAPTVKAPTPAPAPAAAPAAKTARPAVTTPAAAGEREAAPRPKPQAAEHPAAPRPAPEPEGRGHTDAPPGACPPAGNGGGSSPEGHVAAAPAPEAPLVPEAALPANPLSLGTRVCPNCMKAYPPEAGGRCERCHVELVKL